MVGGWAEQESQEVDDRNCIFVVVNDAWVANYFAGEERGNF